MAAAAGRLAALTLPVLLAAGMAKAQPSGDDPVLKLIKGGSTPPAIKADPSTWLPALSCPVIVPANALSTQPLRIPAADVAAKNRIGCISPEDAIYGPDGCPRKLCGSGKGVVPLPRSLPQEKDLSQSGQQP